MFNDQFILTNKDKQPVGTHGLNINHLDPTNWMSYGQASNAAGKYGFEVAYVITEDSPIVCVDVDKCIDPATGQYDERAQKWMNALGDRAYCEISRSGTGLHFWGFAEQGLGDVFRNRVKDEYEFYEKDRFIILGQGLRGQMTDITADLKANLKLRPVTTGVSETGPVPEYTGPADDNQLMQMMLNSKGSAAAAFGSTARFVDLWNGNGLDRWYPTQTEGEPFDRNAAESALATHLAFWTGKDVGRTERLLRASPMVQSRLQSPHPDKVKKLNRDGYWRETVSKAAGVANAVYTKPRPVLPGSEGAQPVSQPILPGAEGTAPVATGSSEYKTIFDQQTFFRDCVYVRSENKVLTPDGALLSKEQFSVDYGGYEYQMQADGARPTRSAWEAFTVNRCHHFPKAHSTGFMPRRAFGEIVDNVVNMYVPPEIKDTDKDAQPFLDLVAKILPDTRDQQILLTWFASMVQNPGVKFQWAVVLQGAEGNGKTFLLNALAHAVGIHNTHLPNPEELHEKYNDFLHNNLLIGVEEVHMQGRREVLDRLKKYITNRRIEIRAMATNKYMADNLTNWIFLTNHKDAVAKTENDRRYCIFYTAQQTKADIDRDGMDGRYWKMMHEWADNGGYDAVAMWLKNTSLVEEFDPAGICHRAPDTSVTAEAIEQTRGPVEQRIMEWIDEGIVGFRGGWISSIKLQDMMREDGVRCSTKAMRDSVLALGYTPLTTYNRGRAAPLMEEGGRRPTLYVTSDLQDRGLSVNNYRFDQGYITTLEPADIIPLTPRT